MSDIILVCTYITGEQKLNLEVMMSLMDAKFTLWAETNGELPKDSGWALTSSSETRNRTLEHERSKIQGVDLSFADERVLR